MQLLETHFNALGGKYSLLIRKESNVNKMGQTTDFKGNLTIAHWLL